MDDGCISGGGSSAAVQTFSWAKVLICPKLISHLSWPSSCLCWNADMPTHLCADALCLSFMNLYANTDCHVAFCHQLNRALKGSIKFNEGDRQEFLLLSFHLLSLRFSFTTVTAGARRDRRLGSARRSVSVAVCSASGILTEWKSAQGEPSLWPTFIAAPFILGS